MSLRSALLVDPDAPRQWLWWERLCCSQCESDIVANFRSVLWAELFFALLSAASVAASFALDGRLTHGDWWSLADLVPALPLLALLLRWLQAGEFSVLRSALTPCAVIAAAYAAGVCVDALELLGAERRLGSRLVTLGTDALSLAMWLNIVYYLYLLAPWAEGVTGARVRARLAST